MNYSRILLTALVSVPSNVTFRANGATGTIDVLSENGELLFTVPAGETAEAVFAFMSGEIVFPVVGNGILDIPKGWADRQAAKVFGGAIRTPLGLTTNIPETLPVTETPLGGSKLNFDKIRERLEEMK